MPSILLPLTLCVLLAVMTAPAQGVQFIAEQVTQSGGHTHRGNLYYRDDMWRIEHNDPGSIEVTIGRKDKGVMWLLVGRTKRFATMPLDASSGTSFERSIPHEVERETIGIEVLDGHPTTLFQVTTREGPEDVVYYQWWAEDLELPLRIARKDGTWIVEYKNVKLRSLSQRLFEIPLHYRPMEVPIRPG
jgi:hypothetical protein